MIGWFEKYFIAVCAVLLSMIPVAAFASADVIHPVKQVWPHQKILGSYDRPSVQRGFQIYREVCSGCHSLRLLSYRNLAEIGFTATEIKTIAADYSVPDEPNEEGEILDRTALPSDRFVSPFKNIEAARYANNGAYPPDMSLLVKAREGGEDYIFSLLTGYEDAPDGVNLGEGMYWNKYFKGHQIAMAPPLSDGLVTYSNGESASIEQAARDLTQFLAWASEPNMEQRKKMGIKVLLFLLAFIGITYVAKRRMWADVH